MKLFNFIKEKSKKLLAITAILVLAIQFALPNLAKADAPQFNFMSQDKETLRGMNLTQNQTDWTDPVTGNPGDEFRGLVYIHNGVPDTTAHNTKVKVTIPSETTNKKAVLSATISADNAGSVSDNLTANLSDNADIMFMPGTVKLFDVDANGNPVQIAIPSGNGDDIVTSGMNIGEIQGCFQFVHFVSFGFRTVPKGVASFEVTKTVRNVTKGESNFVKENFANPGDTLEYRIDFKNKGNRAADAFISDVVPGKTTFVAGSTTLSRDGGAVQNIPDGIVGAGITVPNMQPGETGQIRFKVKVSTSATNGECLINTVTLSFNKISISDTAKTTVKVGVVPTPPAPEKPLPQTGSMSLLVSIFATLMTAAGFGYFKYSKKMKTQEVAVINDLLK